MEFYYEAKEKGGKQVSGTHSGENESDIVKWLKGRGFVPLKIARSEGVSLSAPDDKLDGVRRLRFLALSPRVELQDKLVFFRQLATMIEAGISVPGALAALAGQTQNKRFCAILSGVYERVSAGSTLGAAMAEYPKCFDSITIPLVRSGEESGTLEESLGKLAKFFEDQNNLRRKIISAMTYPAVVMGIAILVLGVMVVVVIPQFERAFANLNVEMPFLTKATFAIGRWMSSMWYTIPLAVILIVFIVSRLRGMRSMKLPIDGMLLKMPLFGDIIFKASLTRAFRTMSSLLRSGVPVLAALEMASEVAGNEKIKRDFLLLRDGASMGRTMNSLVRERKLFSPMIGHMMAVGEETGRTDEMLDKIADWYDAELSEKIKRLSSILEPVMVLFVGVIVAFMTLAIFMPILSAINAFM